MVPPGRPHQRTLGLQRKRPDVNEETGVGARMYTGRDGVLRNAVGRSPEPLLDGRQRRRSIRRSRPGGRRSVEPHQNRRWSVHARRGLRSDSPAAGTLPRAEPPCRTAAVRRRHSPSTGRGVGGPAAGDRSLLGTTFRCEAGHGAVDVFVADGAAMDALQKGLRVGARPRHDPGERLAAWKLPANAKLDRLHEQGMRVARGSWSGGGA